MSPATELSGRKILHHPRNHQTADILSPSDPQWKAFPSCDSDTTKSSRNPKILPPQKVVMCDKPAAMVLRRRSCATEYECFPLPNGCQFAHGNP
jgi:hypothetical protein